MTGVSRVRGQATEPGDIDDASDVVAAERVGCRAGEADVATSSTLAARAFGGASRRRPRIKAPAKRAVDDAGIAVRTGDDLSAMTNIGREFSRVTHDEADWAAGGEDVRDDRASDVAGGGGENDHA